MNNEKPNAKVKDTPNGKVDDTSNGKANDTSNGKVDDTSNGKANNTSNGKVDDTSNGKANDTSNGKVDDTSNGKANDTSNGKVDDTSNGKANDTSNGKVDDTSNGKANDTSNGKVDDTSNGKANDTSNGKVDDTSNGKANDTSNGKVDEKVNDTSNGQVDEKVDDTLDGKVDDTSNGKVNDTSNGKVDNTSSSTVEKQELVPAEKKQLKETFPERGKWGGHIEFLLACIGAAIGLGNVWRFPYLAHKNGGGAFLIPYILMTFVVGTPICLIELTIGQYKARGPYTLYKQMCPLFKGLGAAMVLVSILVCLYYNMLLAWAIHYFFDSFREDLRWQYCSFDFNTNSCFREQDFQKCKAENEKNVFFNRTCFNSTYAGAHGITDIEEKNRVPPTEEYFNLYVLEKSSGIDKLGTLKWQLVLCLLASWIAVALTVIKGVKSSGKVVYFTATFPFLILIILFIRGVTLPGATIGLNYYLIPDFHKLTEIGVWQDATIQTIFSFSIAGGQMITLASYNDFNNNLLRDVVIISVCDVCTSIFAGLVVFSMIGFMAKELKKDPGVVVKSGAGLAFIVYPDGISRMPVSPLWAVLFFFMLFLLGIDSLFSMVEVVTTFIFDEFPKAREKKSFVVIGLCSLLMLLSLPLTSNGGIYVLELMDMYAAGWPYLLNGLFECLIISYIYGIENFINDLKTMTGFKSGPYLKSHLFVSIMTISPLVITILLLMSWIQYTPLKLGDYEYPAYANGIGWALSLFTVSLVPIGVIHELFFKNRHLAFKKRFRTALKSTEQWRDNYHKFKAKEDSKN